MRGHVHFRLRQPSAAGTGGFAFARRLLVISLTVAAAFAGHAAVAKASTCTIPAQNCTQSPIVTQAQGTISQTPATSTTTWNGQLYAIGETTDTSLCQPNYVDDVNTLCDHFELTPQDPSPVRVTITWADS